MDISIFILLIGGLVFAAHLFEWVFSFTKIPDVLLLLLIGLLLGPISSTITPDFFGEAGAVFTVVVLAIMLFEAGTELRLDIMRQAWKGTLAVTFASFIATIAVIGTVLWAGTGLGVLISFMVAAVVGGTSSIVVIPLVDQLRVGGQTRAILLLESAITDVLSIVITLALLAAYSLGHFNTASVVSDIFISFAGACAIGIFCAIAWSLVLNRIRHMHNSLFSTPALVFILFGIAESFSFSGPIAALAFGITLGNISSVRSYIEHRHIFLRYLIHPVTISGRERAFFSEVVFLLQTFFFVFVGISITAADPWALLLSMLLVLLMLAVRIPIVRATAPSFLPQIDRSVMGAMVANGLASAILATLIAQAGVTQYKFIQEVIYGIILFSVVATSLAVFILYRKYSFHRYAQ